MNECLLWCVRGRYVVASNRVLLMLKDGSQAWQVKDFLVEQDRCEVVTIEGKDYPGKGSVQVTTIHIVTEDEVTIENYFPEVGNIP